MIINLHHHFKHVHYVDVSMPPEAIQMIEEQVAWLTSSDMASKVQAKDHNDPGKPVSHAVNKSLTKYLPS